MSEIAVSARPTAERTSRWVYAAMALHTCMAAGTYLLGKAATMAFPTAVVVTLRAAGAAVVLAALYPLLSDRVRVAPADWLRIALLGLVGVPLNQAPFLAGLKETPPATPALLYAATPAVVLLMGLALGREKLTATKAVGVGLAFSGVVVVLLGRGLTALGGEIHGELLLLVAVVAWALYTVAAKPLLNRYPPTQLTALALILGAVWMLPFGLMDTFRFDYAAVPTLGWIGLVYLALITSVVMYFLWNASLRRLAPSRVAVFSNSQPVLTALLSALLYGERLTPEFFIGTALVIGGVYLTNRPSV